MQNKEVRDQVKFQKQQTPLAFDKLENVSSPPARYNTKKPQESKLKSFGDIKLEKDSRGDKVKLNSSILEYPKV